MNGTVKYWDVGRNNAKGQFDFKNLDEFSLETMITKEVSRYLLSSEIDAHNGIIRVGGFRNVGKYCVEVEQ